MINILFISYDGMTDPLGESQVLPYLKGLLNLGYKIHLLSFEKPDNYKRLKPNIEKITSEAGINWYPLGYTKYPPVLSTLFDIYRIRRFAQSLYKKHNIELVHCRSYIAAFGGSFLKQKWSVKFVFDIRGFWSDERMESGIWNVKNPLFKLIYRFFKFKEKQFFMQADYIISLTQAAKEEIETWKYLQKSAPKIQIIPTCADLGLFSPDNVDKTAISKLKTDFKISDDDRVFSYLGSLGNWNLLDEMLDFFKLIIKKQGKAKFLIVTQTPFEIIEKAINKTEMDLSDFIITKAQREHIPALISLSTFSVFFVKPVFSQKASSPTKMAEIMGMGIPIICNTNVGDVEQIINETRAGIAIKEFTETAYSEAIDQLDALLKIDPAKIRQCAIDRFSLESGVEKYNGVYRKVLGLD